MNKRYLLKVSIFSLLMIQAFISVACFDSNDSDYNTVKPPNILFIIMDDVGIDQMESFGYGGQTAPLMPTIDTIAQNGVRFHNTWAMPACSTSRSVIFQGRFPSRTNVMGALGQNDLANSMVTPYEQTLPKLLKLKNYQSALFGKFHIGLQGNSPYGYSMVASLGWDYFYGWMDETGDPSSVDTTAGGVAPEGTYTCGYVTANAAAFGACYKPDNSCEMLSTNNEASAGRICLENGGVLDPNANCSTVAPAYINFNKFNAYSVNPLGINYADGSVEIVPSTDIRARTYRSTASVNAAIDWIKTIPNTTPWMATLSFASDHTPFHRPPTALLSSNAITHSDLNCSDTNNAVVFSNETIEAMDKEIGRLLLETGIATKDQNGTLVYDPKSSNTMIVVVGDNGSLGYTVKLPFDPFMAKGTAYQTGVWVPLVVSGIEVEQADRSVTHMTNIADIYQLFGEIAGIDVKASVTRPLDSEALMPYLKDPSSASIRKWNYTEMGPNLQANGTINPPCQFSGSCSQMPPTIGVCEDNGGVWYGPENGISGVPENGFTDCCEVQVWKKSQNQETTMISPTTTMAVRNNGFKLIRNIFKDYNATSNSCFNSQVDEFYTINEAVPNPKIDYTSTNLLDPYRLNQFEEAEYAALTQRLETILSSFTSCMGDGNLDLKVDEEDLRNWETMSQLSGGKSSWYDVNLDGFTDVEDEKIIIGNLGVVCN